MGRYCAGLVIVALLQPLSAHATTANSLSGRVIIDGALNDYTTDEWVLDNSTTVRETSGDSRWGTDNEISRVALTWDREFLYIGVEARTFDSFLQLFIANRAGGLTTLEETGDFRRAIQLPGAVNLIALAQPGRIPDVARADDSHAFSLVDPWRGAGGDCGCAHRTGGFRDGGAVVDALARAAGEAHGGDHRRSRDGSRRCGSRRIGHARDGSLCARRA
jgi:hypothetical protein